MERKYIFARLQKWFLNRLNEHKGFKSILCQLTSLSLKVETILFKNEEREMGICVRTSIENINGACLLTNFGRYIQVSHGEYLCVSHITCHILELTTTLFDL